MIIRYGLTGILFWLLDNISAYDLWLRKNREKSNVFVLMPVMVDLLIKKATRGNRCPYSGKTPHFGNCFKCLER